MYKIIVLSISLILVTIVQLKSQNLPVITASSELVDIKDGKDFNKQSWSISPDYRPDVYQSNKIGEWVTFYTDQDSISYQIHPDSIYEFVIILNGKDSAYTQIKYVPSYLDVLREAEIYDKGDMTPIPTFSYQDSSANVLKTLRKELNLDAIAGGGNEVSKILNLMHWIHDLIPHDGNNENPLVKNAMSMISLCKKDERGLNCRGLATVLNECYLAMGIKSRFVTCMPKDSIFNDCHVINMVFSQQLNKWIWIDPTHDAYIMDEKGELLGLSEVRKKLINGETIILNPDANWNNKSSTLKENYLFEYMAKNLYRFSCPIRSEYDFETFEKGDVKEYVELIPLDGYNQKPKISESYDDDSGVLIKTFKTNNPDQYWAKPK